MMRVGRHLFAAAALVAVGTSTVRATDQTVPGSSLTVSATASREKLAFKSNGAFAIPAPGSSDDPTQVGATLQLLNPGTGETFTFALPSSHWSLSSAGPSFKYRDSVLAESGRVKVGLIRGSRLSISGRRAGITLNESSQGTLAVILTSGSFRYCAQFGPTSVRRDQPGRFMARNAPPPSSCATAPPPTTSTSVTTMTTSTSTSTTIVGGSTTTSTTTAGSSTTTTTVPVPPGCNCCQFGHMAFTTGAPQIGAGGCGSVLDDTNTSVLSLDCGGLYFGGAGVTVPQPATVPDMGTSITNVRTCSSVTGAFLLDAATDTDVGGAHPNRRCTAAGVTNPEYPGKLGCLFGPPLPLPNTGFSGASVCIVNRVSADASGSGNCGDGSMNVVLPLLSDLYLEGDLLDGSAPDRPNEPGIQPCPICKAGVCEGGPNNGLPCTPGDSASLGAAYPTSHDCPPPPGAGGALYIGALPIPFSLTTDPSGTAAQERKTSTLMNNQNVFCGFCGSQFAPNFQGPPAVPCTSNAQCTTSPFTACKQRNSGAFGVGQATTIAEQGSAAGMCIDDGLVHGTTLVSVFCVPPAFNATVDANGDLPGPGAVALTGQSQLLP